MYPHVKAWLERVLTSKFKGAKVLAANTSEKTLSKWLFEQGFHRHFADYQAYEIDVDVTGVIVWGDKADLAFVECKLGKISLRDFS